MTTELEQAHQLIQLLQQDNIVKEKQLAQLQGIVDAALDFAILEGDEKGIITYFSKGAEKLLGYTADEVVGKTDAGLFHVREEIIERSNELTNQYGRRIRGFDTFVEYARQGRSESREWTYVRKDGTGIPVNLTVTAIRNEDNQITGYLGIAKDVREYKELMSTLAQARDKAQAASLAKSQFLANMSHEIRTPMNAILGMIQLLQQTEMTARQQDYVTKTRSAAQSLLGLLNDILDFSKVEANKMTLERLPFFPDALMRDLAVIFASSVGTKDVEVLFAIDPALPKCIIGDVMRLRQILINLVGNAIKFTKEGEIVVSLQVLAQEAHQTQILFSVKDSGIGIAPEQLASIFESFNQAEASTTRRFGGTGLGLAISQRLVGLMGGELTVESTANVGSRFQFAIQFEHGNEDEVVAATTLTSLADRNDIPVQRVLVIDDNDCARDILLAMVESLGWKGDTASSGEAALAMLNVSQSGEALESPYDVIFVDWKMPGIDGMETVRQIRQRYPIFPTIIMLTAHDREVFVDRVHTHRDLLNGFLVKPVTASMLLDAVIETSFAALHTPKIKKKRLNGLRLLVVEDNMINQQVALELLSNEGAHVELADNGLAGVEKVLDPDRQYDVVLMDVQMPVMDGYTATAKIRQDDTRKSLPIIAMTANVMAADKVAAAQAGMSDHIAKPIVLDDMVNTILRYCSVTNEVEETMLVDKPVTSFIDLKIPTHIDLDNVLERLGGNKKLFTKLAQGFEEEAKVMMADLVKYVDQKDRVSLVRVAHTLKGLAATLGAVDLTTHAAEMEKGFKEGDIDVNIDEIMNKLTTLVRHAKTALDQIILQFNPVGSVLPSSTDNIDVDKTLINGLFDELDTLLQDRDMSVLNVFAELEKKMGDNPDYQSKLSPLADAVYNLDFNAALEHSFQVRKKLQ